LLKGPTALDFLCRFAQNFPQWAASILDRDQHKQRNFREETITDMLMAGLVPFAPMGIHVDFPVDESITGEDMDWEFVNENAVDGRRYLRLHIQAKRAISSTGKKPYWYYRELDHTLSTKAPLSSKSTGARSKTRPLKQHGMQHARLIDEASKIPGCVPIYMFYHPGAAVAPKAGNSPAIEGLNWIFANKIPKKLSTKNWPRADKKTETWRPHFQPLSKILCFGHSTFKKIDPAADGVLGLFLIGSSNPSPGELSDRLNEIMGYAGDAGDDRVPIRAVEEIPASTLAAIRSSGSRTDGADLARPRVIFNSTSIFP